MPQKSRAAGLALTAMLLAGCSTAPRRTARDGSTTTSRSTLPATTTPPPPPTPIVFESTRESRLDNLTSLYSVLPDGTGLTRIVAGNSLTPRRNVNAPAWSSDRRTIIFGTATPFSQTNGIAGQSLGLDLIDPSGANLRPVPLGVPNRVPTEPALSPDNRLVAYASSASAAFEGISYPEIHVMGADGTNDRPLTHAVRESTEYQASAVGDRQPTFSPDGRLIAFTRDARSNLGVYVIGVDGTGERRVWAGPPACRYASHPSWSPDGRFLVFAAAASDAPVASDIFVVGVDGSGLRRLTIHHPYAVPIPPIAAHERCNPPILMLGPRDYPESNLSPSWSRDGRRIAFASDRNHLTNRLGDCPSFELFTMAADGRDVRQLTSLPDRPTDFTCSGDFMGDLNPAW